MKPIFKKIVEKTLEIEAKLVLKKYKPHVVAITGSVGKTSAKDAIYAVLATTFFVRKSSKSLNTEIGVPLTILGLPNAWNDPKAWLRNLLDGFLLFLIPHPYPQWLVIEIGADRPGDIRKIAAWLKTDIVVITRLSDVPAHIEFFASAEQVRHEKAQLVLAAQPKTTVILNADDKLVFSLRNLTKSPVVTFGAHNPADVVGSKFAFVHSHDARSVGFPAGISFEVDTKGVSTHVQVDSVLGRPAMHTALAALAVASTVGLDLHKAAVALKEHESPAGRMKILPGINGSCIIDDTYNSSPIAAAEALETVKNFEAQNKIQSRIVVVLGDMLELGAHSPEEHAKLGEKAAAVADLIYTVGSRAKDISKSALRAGFPKENTFEFHDAAEAGEAVARNIETGDIILVKGSQGVRMEKVVEKIMAESERAGELLVRQEPEWKQR